MTRQVLPSERSCYQNSSYNRKCIWEGSENCSIVNGISSVNISKDKKASTICCQNLNIELHPIKPICSIFGIVLDSTYASIYNDFFENIYGYIFSET